MVLFTTQITDYNLLPKKKPVVSNKWRVYVKQYLNNMNILAAALKDKNREGVVIEGRVSLAFTAHHSNIGKFKLDAYVPVVIEGLIQSGIIKRATQIMPNVEGISVKKDGKDCLYLTLREI